MSKQQSFAVDPLDCEALLAFAEKVASAKNAVDTHSLILAKAIENYNGFFAREAAKNGVDANEYSINFKTQQLEPTPQIASLALPPSQKPPDANDPPAPFRDAGVSTEVKV